MIFPRVTFRYSWIYDNFWRDMAQTKGKDMNRFPSPQEIADKIKILEENWRPLEADIFREISDVTGLEWKKNEITCYVVGRCRAFSDPLTIDTFEDDPTKSIDKLTHELIHQVQIQNAKPRLWWERLREKYGDLTAYTRNHIFVYAVHTAVYLKLFSEDRLKRDIENTKNPEYVKAWEIVQRDGHQNIINDFVKTIQN